MHRTHWTIRRRKSTLLNLLLKFELPASGAIYLDGHELSSLDIAAVRRQIGVVTQDGRLMAGSIYENICASGVNTLDEAWDAVRAAGFAGDIEAMPMGMHTMVSENGGNLSGGQRQRLLIARALVQKPALLLFDEATSALDNQTQAIVTESLTQLRATRILIAHRLCTIRSADWIYVIDKGKVLQQGTYNRVDVAAGSVRTAGQQAENLARRLFPLTGGRVQGYCADQGVRPTVTLGISASLAPSADTTTPNREGLGSQAEDSRSLLRMLRRSAARNSGISGRISELYSERHIVVHAVRHEAAEAGRTQERRTGSRHPPVSPEGDHRHSLPDRFRRGCAAVVGKGVQRDSIHFVVGPQEFVVLCTALERKPMGSDVVLFEEAFYKLAVPRRIQHAVSQNQPAAGNLAKNSTRPRLQFH